jgi:hypothetical protein
MLLLTAALVAACFLLGQAILALCGGTRWRWWAPALGYALLLVVGGQVVRIPNHQPAMLVILAVATVATLALPLVRRAVVGAAPDALPFGLLLLLAGAIPFFATGHTGVLGASVSNDMSQHLTGAFYLRTGEGLRPAAAYGGNLITTGYPLGAHGLAALLTGVSGLGEERVFSAITLAIPVLTGFAVLGLVPAAPRAARWALGAVVGLGYMMAAYLAQGSFKEITEALFVLATALALGDLTREPPRGWWHALRLGVPIAVLTAGAVYNYSYGGAFWMIGAVGVFLLVAIVRRPRALPSILRQAILPTIGALVVAAAVLAPETSRIEEFTKSVFGVEPTTQHGNLFHSINPLETIGPWFSGDFRIWPRPEWPSYAFSALAAAALIGGLVWWWRRRELALPCALVAAIALWAELTLTRNTYNAAKGLVVMAPLATACIGAPLVAAWAARSRVPRTRRLLVAGRVLGGVLLGATIVSTFAVLRSAPVGIGSHEQELASMRPIIGKKPVLFLSNDHFAQWELRGAKVYVATPLYAPAALPIHLQKQSGPPGDPVDVDNYESTDLDRIDFIVTPAARYQSEIPPNFQLVMHTASYELFRRAGPTPAREPIEPPGQPSAVLDCTSPAGRTLLTQYRWAGVVPTPYVTTDWHGNVGIPGHTATLEVRLPAGQWDISLQYLSYTSVVVRAPHLRTVIAPNYGLINEYWPAGTLTSNGTTLTLTLHAENRSWFGRLLGSPRRLLSEDSPKQTPLWHVAFTRHGVNDQRIPVSAACGRWVDWLAPANSTMQ